jgi:hypothetical protein
MRRPDLLPDLPPADAAVPATRPRRRRADAGT